MPKLKTSKTASKRLAKITGTGKLMRRKTLAQHLVKRKTKRTIKSSGRSVEVVGVEAKRLKRLTPYRTK